MLIYPESIIFKLYKYTSYQNFTFTKTYLVKFQHIDIQQHKNKNLTKNLTLIFTIIKNTTQSL
ncbi:hypothetical protein RC62_221 [Flavobacterium aquidurense]|uniref:Uncharacterized protein n=1 Tax=Flavobacterium aquidurense TaxID=362413 RepID=A0A0Q0W1A0_9FLAO|nr:hypothetical protein RC62_221 [Flavobacterium aquidurense]